MEFPACPWEVPGAGKGTGKSVGIPMGFGAGRDNGARTAGMGIPGKEIPSERAGKGREEPVWREAESSSGHRAELGPGSSEPTGTLFSWNDPIPARLFPRDPSFSHTIPAFPTRSQLFPHDPGLSTLLTHTFIPAQTPPSINDFSPSFLCGAAAQARPPSPPHPSPPLPGLVPSFPKPGIPVFPGRTATRGSSTSTSCART